MKLQFNVKIRIFLLVLLGTTTFITACSTEDDNGTVNSGRINFDALQKSFRNEVLLQYKQETKEDLVIAAPASPKVVEPISGSISKELAKWRADISEPWNKIPNDKFSMVCEILYDGVLDKESQLAKYFERVQKQFDQDGVQINSMTDIQLVQDNRKKIQFPTKEFSSSLIECSSLVTFRLASGDLTPPLVSTLSWVYFLEGTNISQTISFTVKSY